MNCASRGRRGFGLLETIVAIGVIVTGLFAVFTLVLSNQRTIDAAKLRFGGVSAAREGAEVVRMLRDANWQRGRAFDDGIITGTTYSALPKFSDGAGFTLHHGVWDFTDHETQIARLPSGFWTNATEATPPTPAERTPYRRIVRTLPICTDPAGGSARVILTEDGETCEAIGAERIGIHVVAMVQWNHGGSTQDARVAADLYDWR
ncbi:MAG: type II secretion system protein [bacterium]|nr:type II secretion system protein [bacterium]